MSPPSSAAHLRLLLRLERARTAAELRRPRPGALAAAGLPAVLICATLVAAGSAALPDPESPSGAIGLAFLVAAPISFFGYGILFRARDDGLLRRLGFSPASLFLVRALRLALVAAAVVGLLLLPMLADGVPVLRPAAILVSAAAAATGAGLLALAHAAALTARPDWRPGVFSGLMGLDPELVKVGPLVYAPLAPLTAALGAGAWIGVADGVALGRAASIVGASIVLVLAAVPRFAAAMGRFAPRAQEMAFSPPPDVAETGLVLDRGVARLLPIRPRAVLARDARLVERRFRWAQTVVWPVAIGSAIALARWGDSPAVRSWVLAAGVLTLLIQGFAVIALGRLEAGRSRWLDHAAGLRLIDRWIGRSAYGFGLSLWLTIPLGIAWGLWAGVGSGWAWLAAGAASTAVAATASMSAARRWR